MREMIICGLALAALAFPMEASAQGLVRPHSIMRDLRSVRTGMAMSLPGVGPAATE